MKKLLFIIALLLPVVASAETLQPLTAADVAVLLKPPAQGERIIAIWALDCAYCEPNLAAVAALQRAHPKQIELVTVTTDNITQRAAIEARLKEMKMMAYPARAYTEASPERINFMLDPHWGGETPRVLVIRADGSRFGISGALTPVQIKKLL